MRPWVISVVLVCASLAGCGGDDEGSGKSTPTSSPSATATPTATGPRLPKEPPAVTAAVKRRLDRCVDRWNADIGDADPKSAHAAIATRAREDADRLLATVTSYDGERVAERRDACVVVVSQGTTVFPPFSRVREGGWVGSCDLVAAQRDPDDHRKCPTYTGPLSREANATFRAAGTLRLRVST